MRKLLHIFLAILLMVSTSGIIGSRHFCGQKLVSIALFQTENSDDCCASDEDACCKPVDCCDDTVVEISAIQTNVTTPGALSVMEPASIDLSFSNLAPVFNTPSLDTEVVYSNVCIADKQQHKRQQEFGCFLI